MKCEILREYIQTPCFIHKTSARPVRLNLARTARVKLNCLRISVGEFNLSMHYWGLALTPNCKCGAYELTADYVLTTWSIHWTPH